MTVTELFAGESRPKTAFVLGGGGNLGSIQVGMLRALFEAGYRPDLVLGSSVGAINASALADDPTPEGVDRLEEVWLRTKADDVFGGGRLSGPWMLARRALSLYSNRNLRRHIESTIAYREFEGAAIPLHVVATSLRTGMERWFSTGPVVDPIMASAALPAALPPVEIEGEWFIDGAVVDNVPIQRAIDLGATRVCVLHVGNFDRPRPLPQRPIEVLLQAFSIARNYRYQAESRQPPEGVELITLPAVDPGSMKRTDFPHTRELISRAHAAAANYLLDAGRQVAGA